MNKNIRLWIFIKIFRWKRSAPLIEPLQCNLTIIYFVVTTFPRSPLNIQGFSVSSSIVCVTQHSLTSNYSIWLTNTHKPYFSQKYNQKQKLSVYLLMCLILCSVTPKFLWNEVLLWKWKCFFSSPSFWRGTSVSER